MDRKSDLTIRGLTFDQMTQMSSAELEAMRRREVDALISQAPERTRRRLRGIQFEIDAKRRVHKSPLASCICISRMMQESLERLNAALQGEVPARRQTETAQIIAFSQIRRHPPGRPDL